jgi:hypothetical protein
MISSVDLMIRNYVSLTYIIEFYKYQNWEILNNENEGDVSTILQECDESGRIKILNISMMYLYTEFPNFDTYRILLYMLPTPDVPLTDLIWVDC